jgi:hypothetical protein
MQLHPMQALSALEADTPYALLLRPGNQSTSDATMGVVAGLLANSFGPKESMKQLGGFSSLGRRLLRDEAAVDAATENPFLQSTKDAPPLAAVLSDSRDRPPVKQCQDDGQLRSSGDTSGLTEVPAAYAEKVSVDGANALYWGPFLLTQPSRFFLRLDVWPTSVSGVDAAESRILIADVHKVTLGRLTAGSTAAHAHMLYCMRMCHAFMHACHACMCVACLKKHSLQTHCTVHKAVLAIVSNRISVAGSRSA